MNNEEAALFLMTLAALNEERNAETTVVDDAEPMTATCDVVRSDE